MDDLISRSALLDEIESLSVHITGLRSGKGVLADCMKEYKKSVLRIIDEQPTAYDVGKVVAELEERKNEYELHSENAPDDISNVYRKGVMRGYEYSKDIVRKGGVKKK